MTKTTTSRLRAAWKAGLLGTAAGLSMWSGAAFAQEADDEIVVTARFQNSLTNRLPIDPAELPFSLHIIDDAAIEERGFINPFDVLETVPNVFRRQTELLPSSGGYNIRGLNATVLTNNRPEGGSRGAGRRDSSYIDQIEVAQGPSSILLGPVIPGGVINQVTKSPEDEDFVELMVRGGSYGTHREELDANFGSLFGSDAVGFRMTLAYEDQQSPQDPEHTETIAVRPVIEVDLGDRTRAQASVAYTQREGVPGSSFPVNVDGSVPSQIDAETYFGVPSEQGGEDLYYDVELQHDFLDSLKLVVRGSYQNADFDYQTSQGGTNYAGGRGFSAGDTIAYTYFSRGFRNEDIAYGDVQLQGNFQAFGQRQDWVIGATRRWTKFENDWGYGGVLGTVDITDFSTASYAAPDFNSIVLTPFQDYETELNSFYGEASIRPFEPLTLVFGARYDDYERDDTRNNVLSETDDITARVGATYALTDGLNAYASYAESFIPQTGSVIRSGESYMDAAAAADPVDPETATNYEIGLKGRILDGRVALTAAAFWLTRENVATADPNNQLGFPSYVIATGEQEHNGYEIGALIDVSEAFNLSLSYGYVDAEVTRVINPGNGQDVGDTVPLTPSHTFSVYGTYTVQTGPMTDLRLGLGVRGISDRPSPRSNVEYDGYTLVDLNAAYPLTDVFDVQFNIHNLLDEDYRETVGFDWGNLATGHRFGNPRSAYVTVRARF